MAEILLQNYCNNYRFISIAINWSFTSNLCGMFFISTLLSLSISLSYLSKARVTLPFLPFHRVINITAVQPVQQACYLRASDNCADSVELDDCYRYCDDLTSLELVMFNRPCVAGAVLQTAS